MDGHKMETRRLKTCESESLPEASTQTHTCSRSFQEGATLTSRTMPALAYDRVTCISRKIIPSYRPVTQPAYI